MTLKRLSMILILFLVVAGGALALYFNSEENSQGECIKIVPPVCVSGRISNNMGLFSTGPTKYYLRFKGEMSKSKEECRITYRVTEARYNKWIMY